MSTVCLRRTMVVALMLVALPAWAQQGAQGSQRSLEGFSIVLVLGDLQEGTPPDNIPTAARAALNDLKDFLPYKSYRLLDTAWILGSTTQLFRTTTRMRGVDEQTYQVNLTSSPGGASALSSLQMKFLMSETGATNPHHADAQAQERLRDLQLKADLMRLNAEMSDLEKSLQSRAPSESDEQRQRQLRDRIRALESVIKANELRPQASTSIVQTLIDTSFTMRLGETVVVGTSRVRGDRALIALLTAVRK